MKNLSWKTNFWDKQRFKDTPELTEYNLKGLMITPTLRDVGILYDMGIRLDGRIEEQKIFKYGPFVYFKDKSGLYAIHEDTTPDEENNISYYQWRSKLKDWEFFEEMSADTYERN